MSFHIVIVAPSATSAAGKLSAIVGSSQRERPEMELTSELCVKDLATLTLDCLTFFEEAVMPAIKMPMIKITIESSIREKALLVLVFMWGVKCWSKSF